MQPRPRALLAIARVIPEGSQPRSYIADQSNHGIHLVALPKPMKPQGPICSGWKIGIDFGDRVRSDVSAAGEGLKIVSDAKGAVSEPHSGIDDAEPEQGLVHREVSRWTGASIYPQGRAGTGSATLDGVISPGQEYQEPPRPAHLPRSRSLGYAYLRGVELRH
jgi:hypothetical protein